MKIVQVTSTFHPVIGGGESYVRYLSSSLARKGHLVYVVTSEIERHGRREEIADDANIIRFGSILRIGYHPVFFRGICSALPRIRPDVVHTHGPSINEDIALFISRVLSIPCVSTYHADFGTTNALVSMYMLMKNRALFHIVDRVVVTTNMYASLLHSRGVPSDKIRIVSPGVDAAFFRPARDKNILRKRYGTHGSKVVLFVGGLGPQQSYKRPDLLIEAFKQVLNDVARAKLLVVGTGAWKARYQRLSKDLGLENHVIFQGGVPNEVLRDYYSMADVLVLPSPTSKEGFGLVLLEAMASGCPVVATTACGGASSVRCAKAGSLVEPLDVEALATAITQILVNDALAEEYRWNGRRYCESERNWTTVANRYENIYFNLLDEYGGG